MLSKIMAKRWAKRENEELDTLSEWVKSVRGILKSRIRNIKTKVCTIYPSVFSKPEGRNELQRLHEEFVLVPADTACNNIVFVRLIILVACERANCDGMGHPANVAICARMALCPISFKIHNSIHLNSFIYCAKEHFLCSFFFFKYNAKTCYMYRVSH
jgi:hypothetical protein